MGRFMGKAAIVTGGASGIGLAAAGQLVAEGARVAIVDLNRETGNAARDRLGAATRFFACDVADGGQAATTIDAAIDWLGGVDALFNNAGVGRFGTATEIEPAAWDAMIAVNLSSVFHVTRRVLPRMRAAGGGAIVNTASVCGLAGDYAQAAYNAAKGGLINFTRSLALDYAGDGIRTNAVCPGVIGDTSMTAHMDRMPGGVRPWFDRIPLGRFGRAEEVARLMLFLASDDASYITGQAIAIDGGLIAHTGLVRVRRESPPSAG